MRQCHKPPILIDGFNRHQNRPVSGAAWCCILPRKTLKARASCVPARGVSNVIMLSLKPMSTLGAARKMSIKQYMSGKSCIDHIRVYILLYIHICVCVYDCVCIMSHIERWSFWEALIQTNHQQSWLKSNHQLCSWW